ncbi:probable LRR receptor-like serine/threonine-protein kinase At3g47570 [Coffea eugenioides]|uniref:probable LRR receptor-like serine/threonine-protein kinase At3g47570 n=1 Tax=Coffea eugenioides TaxID=49369 RepID=UPI000F615E1B|nr:probable LRR receptor-like serine/threonine-protein kinase At3g47570 [Coffea eugenioides]
MWGFRQSTLANLSFILLFAINLSVSHLSASKHFQNETDCLALLEFKNQIYDDPFEVLNSWNHSQHHCEWEGVTCSTRHQRVMALTLRDKHLSGTISPHVGNLSFMRFIHLEENQFRGEIPQEFGHLFRLRVLNLSGKALSGKIPANLSYCSEMTAISLMSNRLEGKIPINQLSNLKKLELLNIYSNNLTGEITSSIGNLPSLITVVLSFNNLGGYLPKEMGLLKKLAILRLGGNKLSVAANFFHGNLPTDIGFTLPNLVVLAVGENKFYGNLPASITNASGLVTLDLSRNNFQGQVPANLGDLTNLQIINFSINLFGNNSTGDLDFVASLTNCSNLTSLSLSGNNFEGEDSFSGFLPREVGKLIHLVDLDVSQNQLAGGIPISLADCTNLENLYMQSNFFQGTIPPNLASLKSIQQLDLSSNNLTRSIPKELEKLQYLRYLNLSYNDIEGEVPNTDFQQCKSNIIDWQQQTLWRHSGIGVPTLPMLLYLLVYRIRERRLVARFSSMPTRIDELLRLSYHELLRATSGFSPENLIGSGNFGAVYKGILEKLGNKLVAVKVVLDLQKNGASKSFKAECKTLRNIRHTNLISIVSHCSNIDSKGDEFKALVYEFMENGNLDLWLHPETTDQATSCRSLNLIQKLNIAIDVASALQYLHDHYDAEIVHCDLKPSNILHPRG